jgi:hypothetical protein
MSASSSGGRRQLCHSIYALYTTNKGEVMSDTYQSLMDEIAASVAAQTEAHISNFLNKNLIPYDGDISKTTKDLRDKGMRLISESTPFNGSRTATTYLLVKVIDSTTVTLHSPKLEN